MAIRILLAALLLTATAFCEDTPGLERFKKQIPSADGPPERSRLYTKPDPAHTGGLKGRISTPELPIEQILATPADNPEEVYLGEITGPKSDSFQFTGLPIGKYDLLVIYDAAFYEGLQLNRDASTLTSDDLAKIETTIQKSEPYFTKKFIHRVEGLTGRSSSARCLCTYYRDKDSIEVHNSDFRRTFKLVILKNVGPGWQIVRARDLYPVWTNPKHVLPSYHHSAALNQIRVADQVKELGTIDLTH
ncbi:MAG: hypothetical protein WCP06_07470 [Verrucomicrobiota bacterium]